MRILIAAALFPFLVMAQNPNVPLAQNAFGTVAYIQNAPSTGTVLNKLASLTGAPSKAVIATAGATSGVVGIVTSGAGTTGTATVQVTGSSVPCVFDGSTTAGNYVQISAAVNGDCTDAGSTLPTSGPVYGRVLTTNSGVGTYKIDLQPSSGSAAVPFSACASGCTTTIGASPWTITAATHGQGMYPTVQTFTGTSPYTAADSSYTQATNGDIVLTYGDSLGLVTIQSAGSVPAPTSATGQVITYTTSHTLISADCGNLVKMNGTSLTFTVANPPPTAACPFKVQNVNASALTISANSLTITPALTSLANGISATFYTDGVNYFQGQGPPGATGSSGTNGTNGINGAGNNALCIDATGSATVYTCPTPSPSVSTLTGLLVAFVPQTTNGATPTLNVATLGAKNLLQSDGITAVTAASLTGGTMYTFQYNGTSLVQTGGGGGTGTLASQTYALLMGGAAVCCSGYSGPVAWTSSGGFGNPPGGYNSNTTYLKFTGGTGQNGEARWAWPVPTNWDSTGTVSVIIKGYDINGASGNFQFTVKIGCIAAGAVASAITFGSATNSSSFSGSNAITQTITGLDASTCSPDGAGIVSIQRNSSVSGNSADDFVLFDARLRYSNK